MKLISCHVENFGRLHDFDCLFRDGLNVIVHENGWGKSTLAAFLLAMLYGMPGKNRSRRSGDNIREAYRPWQGGVYGGRLVFEAGGRTYELTRVFGRREAEDEFDLRDPETNLPSFDFSKDMGKELFRIDRESFLRTAFTSQQDCRTRATDDVNALIADLAGQAGDMGSYEDAQRRLREAANRLTPKRATGRLHRLGTRIGQLERKVSGAAGLEEELEECEGKRKALYEEKERLEEQRNRLNRELTDAERREDEARKRPGGGDPHAGDLQVLRRLQAARDRRNNQVREAAAFFPGRIPTRAETDLFLQSCREMERLEDRMQSLMLTADEQESLTVLEERFSAGGGTEFPAEGQGPAEAGTGYPAEGRGSAEAGTGYPAEGQRSAEAGPGGEGGSPSVKNLPAAGLLLVLAGILLLAVVFTGRLHPPASLPAAVFGAVCLAAGALAWTGGRKALRRGGDDPAAPGAFARAGGGKASRRRVREDPAGAGVPAWTADSGQAREKYLYLSQKEQELEKTHADWADLRRPILRFVRELGFGAPESGEGDLRACLTSIRDAADDYEDACLLLQEAEEDLRLFQENTDPEHIERAEAEDMLPQRIAQLRHLRDQTLDGLQQNRSDLAEAESRLEDLTAELTEAEESRQELEDLRRRREAEERSYRQILEASSILQKARENLTARYADPVRRHFSDHWEMITGLSAAGVHVDAGSAVTVEEKGRQRDLETLSTGCRDLAGICLRTALADAMYTGTCRERPMLIMDDPFTNLDDERTAGALRFLRETGRRFQIIYFTCSRSRAPQEDDRGYLSSSPPRPQARGPAGVWVR